MDFRIIRQSVHDVSPGLGDRGSFGNKDIGKAYIYEVQTTKGDVVKFEFFCGLLALSANPLSQEELESKMISEIEECLKTAEVYEAYNYDYYAGKFILQTYLMFSRQ